MTHKEPTPGRSGRHRRWVRSISVLGVTVLMNSFFFPFMPLVPVFADRLGVDAFLTGVLASATAWGAMLGTFLIARGLPFGRTQGRLREGAEALHEVSP